MAPSGDNAINRTLDRFQTERSNGRRFHADAIGKDVDSAHCFGDFLVQVAKANSTRGPDQSAGRKRLESVYKTALSEEAGGPTGGYTVPPELRDDLMRDVTDLALFRSRSIVVPMASATLDLPLPDATTVPSASGVSPFFGGLQPNFTITAASPFRSETEPKFRSLELKASILGGYTLVSNPMMQDAAGLEAWLRNIFAWSLAWYEDWFFLNGTGAGQPEGLITTKAQTTVARQTGSQFQALDAQKMLLAHYTRDTIPWADFDGGQKHKGLWILTRAAAGQLTSLTGWFPNGPLFLHGAPVALTTKQPALGTKGDVILADLSFYIIGDRQQVDIAASAHEPTAYLANQTAWRVIERVDGRSMLNNPITLPDGGATQISPFVVLV